MSSYKDLKAFEIVREEELPDIGARGIELRHRKSGARVALIPCGDSNKVFNIAFRTPPADSTGVAHIIEHSVLCGSKNYPLKDPFVELVKGSLNTFLNAMTYPDKTMYPVASTNEKDFMNLMSVYLDAVFFPNIYSEENIFRQEGWHYELKEKDAPLDINGVVYNEMKGAFSTAESVLEREIMNVLFPDTPYGVESGGDPVHIPELTYEGFLDFHRRYYHPSNSYIYLYGDMDMAACLEYMDENYLSLFDAIDPDSEIALQKPFGEMRVCSRDYPASEGDDAAYLSLNFVCGDTFNNEEMTALSVLDYALLSSPGAPLKQALLDEGIGLDIYGGVNDGILQPYFSIIAKNAKAEDAERFVEIVKRVAREQVENGINKNALTAGINIQEFSFREADYAGLPKGLIYGLGLFDTWLYDDDKPFSVFEGRLKVYRDLKEKAESGYFEQLLDKMILGSDHSSLLTLVPKAGLAAVRDEEHKKRMAEIKAAMSEEEINALIGENEALLRWQDSPENEADLLRIPVLAISDISRSGPFISNEPCDVSPSSGEAAGRAVRTVFHDAPTNGIDYIALLYDVRDIPEEEIQYLSLLRHVLFNVDTAGHSYNELTNEINIHTGGVTTQLATESGIEERDTYTAFINVRAKVLADDLRKACELMAEVMTSSSFDDAKRIKEIISQLRSQLEIAFQTAGNRAAAARVSAYFNTLGAFEDMTAGIAFYRFIKGIEDDYDNRAEEVKSHLAALCERVFEEGRLTISFTSTRDDREALKDCLPLFMNGKNSFTKPVYVKPYGNLREAFTTPGQVQFVAHGGSFGAHGHKYSGVMRVFCQIMNYEYLWQNIRVRGGAYGCSSVLKLSGDGVFVSYRDPNLRKTLETYANVPSYLDSFDCDERTMNKFIIGTVSPMDTPLTPSMVGSVSMKSYLQGQTQEDIDRRRCEILDASVEDIRALAPVVSDMLKDNYICVVGSESAVKADSDIFDSIESLL